jgi:uncharacterized iron-regulated protein
MIPVRSCRPAALLALLGGIAPGFMPAPLAAAEPPPAAATVAPQSPIPVIASRAVTDLERLLDAITDRRVVFVGEIHDRYEDHLSQLQVIEGLKRRGQDLAIGLECFRQPDQAALDAYLAGESDEAELLRRTRYFERWGFDYRLYRPILRYARDQRIPVIALNLAVELTSRVGQVGIAGLNAAERAQLPEAIDRTDRVYETRLRAVFDQHPGQEQQAFERFLDVQLLWDEGMAERAARYLTEHPQRTLVVLAGVGHVEYGLGIPKRLGRRVPAPAAILVNGRGRDLDPAAADYLLFPKPEDLPAAGKLGVRLGERSEASGVPLLSVEAGGGARAAGVRAGDRLVRIGDQPVASLADVHIALLDRSPGQRLPVVVQRPRPLGREATLTFTVKLH